MKRISIDNGITFVTPSEALAEVELEDLEVYMDEETAEEVHYKFSCNNDEEFLTQYLILAKNDLIFG